jgi:MATE family multidrug resistance protein
MTDWITEPMGVYGFWFGFIGGLTTSAILLSLRLRWLQKNPTKINMEVDELQIVH